MMWYTLPPSKYSALEGWESRKVGHRVCPIRWGTHSSLWLSVHCPNSWGTHSSLCLSTVPFAEGQLPLSVCLSVCPQFACPLVSFRARVPPPKHTHLTLSSHLPIRGEKETQRGTEGEREIFLSVTWQHGFLACATWLPFEQVSEIILHSSSS